MVETAAGRQNEPVRSDRDVFRIALSMSGAISAGAYTAGVFDFLMQALAELEAERRRPGGTAPGHEVRIVAMAGASAGGITAALGTVALGYGLAFVADRTSSSGRKPCSKTASDGSLIDCVLPSLYEAWVVKPRMVGVKPGDPCLLSTEDLKGAPIHSLLNAKVLEDIRAAALLRPAELSDPATQAASPPHRFLAEPLHLYLTVSNVAGIPYTVKGSGPADAYHMLNHGDRLHFRVRNIGGDPGVASDWAQDDERIPLDAVELAASVGKDPGWQKVGDGALATAAFPAGLSARWLSAMHEDFSGRRFPAPEYKSTVSPDWSGGQWSNPFQSATVDGGMINNDPFDFARYCLLDDWRSPHASNPRDAREADRAVLMIAPFPERPVPTVLPDIGLVRVVKALAPTLMQQARFKLSEVLAAADPTYASRWLIAPRRTGDPGEVPSSANIACGLLGGFGGFLDQKFREHDFQLGRRNCQRFLQANWTQSKFTKERQPIIPLFGSALREAPQPKWPKMSQDDFATLMVRIRQRADGVAAALLKETVGRWAWYLLAAPLWWLAGRWLVSRAVRKVILADLTKRKQLHV